MKDKLSKDQKDFFKKNGYLVIKNFFPKKKITKLKSLSSNLFNSIYPTGISPDRIKWNKSMSKKIPRQLCNVWKSDINFKKIITDKRIAKLASQLMGWNGVRLGQDSLIWVASKGGGISMHQDDSYQDWHSSSTTITCSISLTDVNENNSGLQFLKGSHLNKKSKPIKKFFFGKRFDYTVKKGNLKKFTKVVVEGKAGIISFHHGNLWHGSNVNLSSKDRISIVVHLIPMNSKFKSKINHPVYSHYKKFNTLEMDENFFPILWSNKGRRSKFL